MTSSPDASGAAQPSGASPAGVLADIRSLGGSGARIVELDDAGAAECEGTGLIRIGLDRAGRLPSIDPAPFDILMTTRPDPPAPWVQAEAIGAATDRLVVAIDHAPVASAVCARILRATLALSFGDALTLESLGYSMLLASDEFRRWRERHPPRAPDGAGTSRVCVDYDGPSLAITLARPARRNAFDARMRDDLAEALEFALIHPDLPPVILRGEGPAFSAGGDLDEFGTADDVGIAHLVRTTRSPVRLAMELKARLTVRLHGACIGAGIEVPAAAARIVAAPGSFFRLPELSMGLIPGAGGTASVPRRIGRHRAAYMALSGAEIHLPTALAWGLVDAEAPLA